MVGSASNLICRMSFTPLILVFSIVKYVLYINLVLFFLLFCIKTSSTLVCISNALFISLKIMHYGVLLWLCYTLNTFSQFLLCQGYKVWKQHYNQSIHYFYIYSVIGIYGQISTRNGEPKTLKRPFGIVRKPQLPSILIKLCMLWKKLKNEVFDWLKGYLHRIGVNPHLILLVRIIHWFWICVSSSMKPFWIWGASQLSH